MGHDGSSGSAILAAQWAMHDDPPLGYLLREQVVFFR